MTSRHFEKNPRGEDPGDKVAPRENEVVRLGCTWCWAGSFPGLSRNKRRATLGTRLGVSLWSPRTGDAKCLVPRSIISLALRLTFGIAQAFEEATVTAADVRSEKQWNFFLSYTGLFPLAASPITRAATGVVQNVSPLAGYPLLHTMQACARFGSIFVIYYPQLVEFY